ncbi:MAG: mechanosensitive ion channel family protein [Candidatus Krumholzibacteria bacterium]|nr:mechanosensitive ion channel family protein [Candidatus Krumholzibacteria bacterium]MDH4337795.1 mechanosensitive ion channel family protein [Candidatus Krumholzibacteria bacterium]MDH5270849.1 mechanosensitive ion channel family protein [Candidatus Krumholzibacteria bacterium]MDH5627335.1 mechanosensitive ion channel family protein [Candidatus Krumholzibacteria bacterium]
MRMRLGRWMGRLVALALLFLVHALAAGAGTPALTDTTLAASAPEAVAAYQPATLTIANRPVFVFRGELMGYSPDKRLETATQRLQAVMAERGPGKVTVGQNDLGAVVQVDGRLVFVVTKGDVDPFLDQSFQQFLEAVTGNLEAAIVAYREQRSLNAIISALLRALLATVIMVRAIQYLRRLVIWLTRWLGGYAEGRVQRLKEAQSTVAAQLVTLVRLVVRLAGLVLALLIAYSWLAFVLDQFPYTSPWGDQLGGYLGNTVLTVVMAIVRSIPGLLMVVIIFTMARFIARWSRLLFEAVRDGRMELPAVDADTALPTQRLISIFIWLLAVALAFPFIPGSGGAAFKGLSVLLGLMVSLGASSVVSQAASGYILMYSRSLRVGDYVKVAEHEGTIMSMSMLSTKIRTPRDEEINVPNAVIVSSITKNYTRLTRNTGAMLPTTITIGYSTPWRQVHAMLITAAERTEGIRKDAKPGVLQSALSDFYVEYTLLVRLERPDTRASVASALHANIQDVFNEHGVQIMSPHYENDPAEKVWVPREKWHEPPASGDDV